MIDKLEFQAVDAAALFFSHDTIELFMRRFHGKLIPRPAIMIRRIVKDAFQRQGLFLIHVCLRSFLPGLDDILF